MKKLLNNTIPKIPDFHFEESYILKGFSRIVGVDEAGRGPLAGPVVASAVWLPENLAKWGIKDSKLLTATKRDEIFDLLINSDADIGIGIVNHKKIDEINIYQAAKLAMIKAIKRLSIFPDCLLVDGMSLDNFSICYEKIIKGDRKVLSIAAASIVAKVTRDRIMERFDLLYPGYGFAKHKGYPTKFHIEQLTKLGVSPIHRRTFKPVARLL